MANENDSYQNTKLKINWLGVNVPTIIAIISLALVGVKWGNGVEQALTENAVKWEEFEKYRTSRAALTDKRFDAVDQKLRPLDTANFQLQQHDTQIMLLNQRFDALATALAATLDTVKTGVATLNTKVEVLDQKFDSLAQNQRPTTR